MSSNRRCECLGKDNDCPKCHGLGYVEPNVKLPQAQRQLGQVIHGPNSTFFGISSGCSRTVPVRPDE